MSYELGVKSYELESINVFSPLERTLAMRRGLTVPGRLADYHDFIIDISQCIL